MHLDRGRDHRSRIIFAIGLLIQSSVWEVQRGVAGHAARAAAVRPGVLLRRADHQSPTRPLDLVWRCASCRPNARMARREEGSEVCAQRALRVFFATDVHGSERCSANSSPPRRSYEADVLCSAATSRARASSRSTRDNGTLRPSWWRELSAGGRRGSAQRRDQSAGLLPRGLSHEDVSAPRRERRVLDRLFREEIVAQVRRWCELADERLDPMVRCIITPGNDDPLEVDAVLAAAAGSNVPSTSCAMSARCSSPA